MIVFYCVQVSFASVLRVYGVVITDTSKPLSLTSTCTYLTPPWVLALSASTDGKNQCKPVNTVYAADLEGLHFVLEM